VVDSPPGPSPAPSPPLPSPRFETIHASAPDSRGHTVSASAPPDPAHLAIPLPRSLATTAPTPSMAPAAPQASMPETGSAAVSTALPAQAHYARPQESGIAPPGHIDPRFMAMTSGFSTVHAPTWGLRHVLLGGLVGGIIAGLGLWLWASL